MSVLGVSKFNAQVNDLKAEPLAQKYVNDAGNFVRNAAVMLAPADSGYLRQNIYLDTEEENSVMRATVYTNVEYAPYVEFGTGPKGAENHAGTSPEVSVSYRLSAWWIHEDMLAPGTGEKYGWFYVDTPEGRFYRTSGQPAQPFMYPALKDNEDTVKDILIGGLNYAARKATR